MYGYNYSPSPTYNVLLLGRTQAGKSTFVEALRKYADQSVTVNERMIGNGNYSHTDITRTQTIYTDLPQYEIMETTTMSGVPSTQELDYRRFIQRQDPDDYLDAINKKRGMEMVQIAETLPYRCCFNIIDTPGLDDTEGRDEKHVWNIYAKLRQVQTVHLVLFLVSGNVMTPSLQKAIQCYGDVFPELKSVISFVHTQTDYLKLHPTQTEFHAQIEAEKKILQKLMRHQSNFLHFTIDCNLKTTRPIRNCMTQNILHDILALATRNQPVAIRMLMINKTPRMKETDRYLWKRLEGEYLVRLETLSQKSRDESRILQDLRSIESKVREVDNDILKINEWLRIYNVEDYDVLYEQLDSQSWGVVKQRHIRTMEYSNWSVAIDKVDYWIHNMKKKDERGGQGRNEWSVSYKRNSHKDGYFQVKLYAKRNNIYHLPIRSHHTRLHALENERVQWSWQLEDIRKKSVHLRANIQSLLDTQERFNKLSSYVNEDQLDAKHFEGLVLADAYLGDLRERSRKVEAYYMK
ncbi:hypothetical protein BGX27_005375 [Mortierella sp. AM989]|nr:hypothetical protein BGX27_005375 [Mortierella sp. AM989]